jgi:hypothetical protein
MYVMLQKLHIILRIIYLWIVFRGEECPHSETKNKINVYSVEEKLPLPSGKSKRWIGKFF